MRQRLTTVAILFGLVSLPVAVTTLAKQLEDYSNMPAMAVLASPAIIALTLEHHRPRHKA